MNKAKLYLAVGLFVLVLVFILQNVDVVSIRFLLWELSLSRALMFFILLAVGVVIGWALGSVYRRRAK